MSLKVSELTGEYACRKVNLIAKEGEVLVIIGPNGAGKSTLLSLIAGFLKPVEGTIELFGRRIEKLPPQKRKVGYLPQEYYLLPHYTVAENLLFPLKCRKIPKRGRKERLEEWTEKLKLSKLLNKFPRELSGGERRRVALAQALIYEPDLLLLDEPSSGLDLAYQKRLRLEIKRLKKELKIPILYITHNLIEAEEVSDEIALMMNGKIIQQGKLEEIISQPKSEEVKGFFGYPNVFHVEKAKNLNGPLYEVESEGIRLILASETPPSKVIIYPWDIYVSKIPPPGPKINRFRGKIKESWEGSSGEVFLKIDLQGKEILAITMNKDSLPSQRGEPVYVIFKLRNIKPVSAP